MIKEKYSNRTIATTMSSQRKTSLVAGILYLLTFVSIPTLSIYSMVKSANYIVGPGPDTSALIGAVLEVIVALAGIGTAVALYPVVKKQNEGLALGFVASRTLEAAGIIASVACILTIVTLRQTGAGAGALLISQTLVALYDRLFLLSGSLMPAINGLLLGSLLYRSRLVPRILPLVGLIGAPLLLAGDTAVLFGLIGRVSPLAGILALPIALWEFSLGIWLVVKGFNKSSVTLLEAKK